MSSITLDEVTYIYPDSKGREETTAVDRFSLAIGDGELLSLVGPSGCGKTTLLRLISGLILPDEGAILFDAENVEDRPPEKRDVGFVFQSFALYPHLTVFENMAFRLKNRHVKKQEIKEAIYEAAKILDIEYLLNRKPKELSLGQRQRVALGRAIVGKPGILLLDEPFSNLDERLRAQLREEVRRIHRETGATMVYVTHDQREAVSLGERIAVMDAGALRWVGTPGELMTCGNEFVCEFMSEVRDGTVPSEL